MTATRKTPQQMFQESLILGMDEQRRRIEASEEIRINDDHSVQSWESLGFVFQAAPDADALLPELWPSTRDLLLAIAPKIEATGDWKRWMSYLDIGIYWSQAYDDQQAEATFRLHVGVLAQLQNQLEIAKEMLTQSVDLYKALGIDKGAAIALNWMGYVTRLHKKYDLAEIYIDEALSLLTDDDFERELSYFVYGTIAYDQRAWEKSEKYFKQSFTLCNQIQDQHRTAKRLRDLSSALQKQMRLDEATDYCRKAVSLFEQVRDPYHCAIAQMNLGNAYLYTEPQLSLEFYSKAKPVFVRLQDKRHLAMIDNNQGFAYYQLQCWADAEHSCSASIARYEEIGDIDSLVDAMDGLGLIYSKQKKKTKAIQTFQSALSRLYENGSKNTRLTQLIKQHLKECTLLEERG
ncbi:MAG: tetratricopeptide repeat protein [Chloroflexota bacterium]